MIPTFVFGWPTGQEKGDFLALDLGERSGAYATFPFPWSHESQVERIFVCVS